MNQNQLQAAALPLQSCSPRAAGAASATQDTEPLFDSLSSCPCHAVLQPAHTSPDPASQGTSAMELSAATHARNVQQPGNYLVEKVQERGSTMGRVLVSTAVPCQQILGHDGN